MDSTPVIVLVHGAWHGAWCWAALQAELDGRGLASLAIDGFGAAIVPATAVPTWLTGPFRRINVPELPRRVVASIRRRRPTPSAPTHVTLDTLGRVIAEQGEQQPGVHPETAALPGPRAS